MKKLNYLYNLKIPAKHGGILDMELIVKCVQVDGSTTCMMKDMHMVDGLDKYMLNSAWPYTEGTRNGWVFIEIGHIDLHHDLLI